MQLILILPGLGTGPLVGHLRHFQPPGGRCDCVDVAIWLGRLGPILGIGKGTASPPRIAEVKCDSVSVSWLTGVHE